MVASATSLTRSGLRDWIIQRISAVVIAVYTIIVLGFIVSHPGLTYTDWQGLFAPLWMRLFSFIVLLSLLLHAWVGMWTIATDYIKPVGIRVAYYAIVALALFAFVAWGIEIIWSL